MMLNYFFCIYFNLKMRIFSQFFDVVGFTCLATKLTVKKIEKSFLLETFLLRLNTNRYTHFHFDSVRSNPSTRPPPSPPLHRKSSSTAEGVVRATNEWMAKEDEVVRGLQIWTLQISVPPMWTSTLSAFKSVPSPLIHKPQEDFNQSFISLSHLCFHPSFMSFYWSRVSFQVSSLSLTE